jgi:hypothetical protein
MRSSSGILVLLCLFSPGVVQADGPIVDVASHDGTQFTVTNARFATGWKLTGSREGSPVELDVADLVSIRFSDKTPPTAPKGSYLSFPTDERFAADVVATDGENIRVRNPLTGEATVALSTIRGIVVTPESREALGDLSRRAKEESSDQVLLRNQDVITGIIQTIEPTKIVLLVNDEEKPIVRDLVAAVAFDPSLTDYKNTNDFFGQVRLSDGSILNVFDLASEDNKLRFKTGFAGDVAVDTNEIIDISFRNGRVIYLSDLAPATIETQAYLDGPEMFTKDKAVTGGQLRLGGKTYTKGLGARSRSKISYELTGFERFEAVVGLDEAAGSAASVRFIVELDGKPSFDSGEMLSTSSPVEVKLGIKEAKTLSLIVDFESRGDAQDYADWANARFVR